MNFNEIKYIRIEKDTFINQFKKLLKTYENSENIIEKIEIISSINSLYLSYLNNKRIAEIRNLKNLSDTFYEKEVEYLNKTQIEIDNFFLLFYKKIINNNNKDELIKHLGKEYFSIIENKVSALQYVSEGLLQKEASYINEYKKQINTKKDCGDLYINLINTRNKIAINAGYKNYLEFAYKKNKSSYTISEIHDICKYIKTNFVNTNLNLQKIKAHKNGYIDLNISNVNKLFNRIGEIENFNLFIGKFKKGLETISIDIAHHFEYLYNNDYTDLEHRENKYPVTMNIGLPSLNASFILNSIGKKGLNAITLCHEIGHAYQSYKSKNKIELSFEYMRPSNDVAEIQACSMEFFYYDQYQLLFENNTAIIQFSLFEKILFFIIKCCAYEELQRFVYDEKNITKSKMNNKWLSIRKEYYPYMTNEYFNNDTYYTEGNEWQENFQLFMNPFNEMSYTISYIHAIENWQKFTLNKNETIANYETLCSLGGSVSYKEALNILNLSGLNNESKLKDISLFIEKELNKLDLSINSF